MWEVWALQTSVSYPQEISSKRKFSVGDSRTSTGSYCDPGDVYNRVIKEENECCLGEETDAKDSGEMLKKFVKVKNKDWCNIEEKNVNAIVGK